MPRRPDLTRAMLLAGLICLGVFLSNRGWCREATGTPVRFEEVGQGPVKLASLSYRFAAHQIPPNHHNPPEAAAPSNSFCSPVNLNSFTGGFIGSLLCHYVYGYPLSYVWQEGLWPPGLLDLLVLLAFAYLGISSIGGSPIATRPPRQKRPRSFCGHTTRPRRPSPSERRPGPD
jgi:hypothetical protein